MRGREFFKFTLTIPVAALLTAWTLPTSAMAAPAASAEPSNRPAAVAHAGGLRLESAEILLKALIRRSLELKERATSHPSQGRDFAHANPALRRDLTDDDAKAALARIAGYRRLVDGGAPPPRPRLSARLAGPEHHRFRTTPAPAADLAAYVTLLSRTSPGGVVTGRFADWRSPSIYRRVSGRHNGYDVALKAGSPAVAGWAGRVSAVTPWYGREYGVTVISPDGFRTTYGHIAPSVRVGAHVEPGDVVGIVVVDHVDIKMKDSSGKFVDFARGVPLENLVAVKSAEKASPGGAGLAPQGAGGAPALRGPDWASRPEAVEAAITYLRLRNQEASILTGSGPRAVLPSVQRQVAECRSRLLLYGVPEEVLLAPFAESPQVAAVAFTVGDAGDVKAGGEVLGDWLRRQQVMREARDSADRTRSLIKDLSE